MATRTLKPAADQIGLQKVNQKRTKFLQECRFASQPTFQHCGCYAAWNIQEVMTALLHVECDVSRSICLLCSNVRKPAVNGQEPAATCERHSTLGFSRFHSECTDRPFFRSVSDLRERRDGKLIRSSDGLGLKSACHSALCLCHRPKPPH